MENLGFLGPTCVLKVNLQCCEACPHMVKKQLKKIEGVTYIHIDTKKGLVTVSGVANASVLIKAIKKVGRKAELYKFEMQPKHQHDLNFKETHCTKAKHMNRKHTQDDNHSDSDTDSSSDDKDVHAHHFNGHGTVGSSGAIPGYHHPHIAMQGPAGYFPGPVLVYPPARPYRYEGAPPVVYGRPPPHPYNYNQPRPPPLTEPEPEPAPAPRSPTYPVERKHSDGPVGNSLVHTFDDLNVNGCTIF